MTADTVGRTMAYDADSRMTAYNDIPAMSSNNRNYGYDGEGRRVRKSTTSGIDTVYVYDAFGRLAAEYKLSFSLPVGIQFRTTDHLGSTRLVTDYGAAVLSRHDYSPFGEEIPAGLGGRSTSMGYGQPGLTQKFTAKERDAESGIDYFGARYTASSMGRFDTPDEILFDQFSQNPQSWNLYAYVRNNPLRFTDPVGQKCIDPTNPKKGDDDPDNPTCPGAREPDRIEVREFAPLSPQDRQLLLMVAGYSKGPVDALAVGTAAVVTAGTAGMIAGGAAGVTTTLSVSQTGEILLFAKLVQEANARLAANPALAKELLTKGEYAAYRTQNGFRLFYGHAVERLTARLAQASSRYDSLFQYVSRRGGRGPDFIGRSGTSASGLRIDITTVGEVLKHRARPYGPGLVMPTYTRPPSPF